MEKPLSFDFMLSLKEIALRRVTVNLWKEPDVLSSIEKFPIKRELYGVYSENWCESVEKQVVDKVSKLLLPESLRKQMLAIVTPIGLQIKRWKGFHQRYLSMPDLESIRRIIELDSSVLEKLCWTTSGKIDYRQTAEEIIHNEMVDIVSRYRLACLYCLEDRIPHLWEEVPAEIKIVYDETLTENTEKYSLEYCWLYILKGEQSKMNILFMKKYFNSLSFNQNAFIYSASHGNIVATKYFFSKLTYVEKESSLLHKTAWPALHSRVIRGYFDTDHFPSDNSSEIICYFLSFLDHDQQMELFKELPTHFFIALQDWPCQDIFSQIIDLVWSCFPPEDYAELHRKLSYYFKKAKYYFPKLFEELFTRSPEKFREVFAQREFFKGDMFSGFFDNGDSGSIQTMFKHVSASSRVLLVTSRHVFTIFNNCILRGEVHFVEMCLRAATLSKEDKETVKKSFSRFLGGEIKGSNPIFDRFLQLLDKIYPNSERKRSFADETPSETKKRCVETLFLIFNSQGSN